MIRRTRSTLATLVLLLAQLSCAAGTGIVPERHSMPAARAALAPEHRVFYDTLGDYGDWVLIEPYGYVFRPRARFDTWRPYGDGFWVPTDLYGWVWVSSEPFGWATYHYGQWFYDSFQGWVWVPGIEWGPAWVAWEASEDYVGWAPLAPAGARTSGAPGGAYTYVRAADLAQTDLKNRMLSEAEMGHDAARAQPVRNVVEHEGVIFDRGPDIDWVERQAGPIRRVRIDDLVPTATLDPVPVAGGPGALSEPAAAAPPREQIEEVQRAAEQSAAEVRELTQKRRGPPARMQLVRPLGVPGRPAQAAPSRTARPGRAVGPGRSRSAAPDTTRE